MSQQVAVIGYGVEGQAALAYWQVRGAEVTVCDQNVGLALPPGVAGRLGPDYLAELAEFDLVVRSPFVRPDQLIEAGAQPEQITSNLNEFMRVCPSRNIIGITGTKGKGTTSTLIAKMLEAAGHKVHLGGNIGVAPLALLAGNIQPDDWVVLELSSFQLIDLEQSPPVAVCLMVVPEHLNWHPDMAEYIRAKSQLFRWQISGDTAVYFAENATSRQIASAGVGQQVPYYAAPGAYVEDGMIKINGTSICATSDLKLLGAHNWQNACAAVTAVWQALHPTTPDEIAQLKTALRQVLTTFSGLEHRLELVRELGGVRYYDDSFGTTPETAQVAVQAFTAPKVLILGGSDKGASYDELAATVATGNVRQALLIGDQAPHIQAALEKAGFRRLSQGGGSMSEIVANAQAAAQPGDVVLLSTGCASFGMFKDYKDRGNQFKAAVQALD